MSKIINKKIIDIKYIKNNYAMWIPTFDIDWYEDYIITYQESYLQDILGQHIYNNLLNNDTKEIIVDMSKELLSLKVLLRIYKYNEMYFRNLDIQENKNFYRQLNIFERFIGNIKQTQNNIDYFNYITIEIKIKLDNVEKRLSSYIIDNYVELT